PRYRAAGDLVGGGRARGTSRSDGDSVDSTPDDRRRSHARDHRAVIDARRTAYAPRGAVRVEVEPAHSSDSGCVRLARPYQPTGNGGRSELDVEIAVAVRSFAHAARGARRRAAVA